MKSTTQGDQSSLDKPLLLDFFCKAGGCTKGYQRAGFYVVGVDKAPQPNYCGDEFHQADAFDVLERLIAGEVWEGHTLTDFVWFHGSPPCQAFTSAQVIHGNEHPDLLTPFRELLLKQTAVPWVLENVPNSPMRRDLILCGSMFPELRDGDYGITRHRWFEFSEPHMFLVQSCQHAPKVVSVFGHGGHIYHGVEQWRRVMGIDWMKRDELAQAIPPAYTELIGHQLMQHITAELAEEAA